MQNARTAKSATTSEVDAKNATTPEQSAKNAKHANYARTAKAVTDLIQLAVHTACRLCYNLQAS